MGTRKTYTQKLLEELYSLKWNKEVDMKQILKRLYIDEKRTIYEVSKILKVSQGTVSGWLKHYGIPARGWNFKKK